MSGPCVERGQVLFTGIALSRASRGGRRRIAAPEFFSGWGIRTVAKAEARYNPMSYHNGSIWPHDNALISLGFARYDRKREIERVFTGLFDCRDLPGPAPTAGTFLRLSAQPWSRADPLSGLPVRPKRGRALTHSLVGKPARIGSSIFGAGEIRLRNPCLPAFLQEVVLRNLGLGRSNCRFRVSRRDKGASVDFCAAGGYSNIRYLVAVRLASLRG